MSGNSIPADDVLADIKKYLEIRELASPGAEFARNKKKEYSTLDEQIAEIDSELLSNYDLDLKFDALTKYESARKKEHALNIAKMKHPNSTRLPFLIYKRDYLVESQRLINKLEAYAEVDRTVGLFEHKHPMMRALHIWKKIADVLDDIWNIIKGALPPELFISVGPFLTSVTGFFIHCMEGYDGISDATNAYYAKKMPQRKTRLLTGILTAALALLGVGLSITLFAATFGPAVQSYQILQVLIPGILACIYSLSLARNCYIYDQSKYKAERSAIKLNAGLKELKNHQKNVNIKTWFASLIKSEKAHRRYVHYNKAYPLAERRVFFNAIEVIAAILVVIGTFQMSLIGLIVGVCLGFAGKMADWYDEKYDFVYYNRLREKMARSPAQVKGQSLSKSNFMSSYAKTTQSMTPQTSSKYYETYTPFSRPASEPLATTTATPSPANTFVAEEIPVAAPAGKPNVAAPKKLSIKFQTVTSEKEKSTNPYDYVYVAPNSTPPKVRLSQTAGTFHPKRNRPMPSKTKPMRESYEYVTPSAGSQ